MDKGIMASEACLEYKKCRELLNGEIRKAKRGYRKLQAGLR